MTIAMDVVYGYLNRFGQSEREYLIFGIECIAHTADQASQAWIVDAVGFVVMGHKAAKQLKLENMVSLKMCDAKNINP
jgi:hypothetical protein